MPKGTHGSKISAIVDCANGVGALKLERLLKRMDPSVLHISLINKGSTHLNEKVGAFVWVLVS